jgi:hypothetical protein
VNRKSSVVVVAVMLAASVAGAQSQPPPASSRAARADAQKARYHIAVMEGVLEQAVRQGARVLNQRFQAISPTIMLLGGGGRARVRGFRLEGYGVFFDVDVPAVPQSMVWSMRLLGQNGAMLASEVQVIRRHINTVVDPSMKRELEDALRRLEQQVTPVAIQAPPTPAGAVSVPVPSAVQAQVEPLLEDPAEAYTNEVKDALIDAMLEWSHSLGIATDEWLTVAARDNEEIPLSPNDLSEAMTMTFRIKGGDLAAYHARRLTKDEAKKRVEIREF